jgi:hypothetical protein
VTENICWQPKCNSDAEGSSVFYSVYCLPTGWNQELGSFTATMRKFREDFYYLRSIEVKKKTRGLKGARILAEDHISFDSVSFRNTVSVDPNHSFNSYPLYSFDFEFLHETMNWTAFIAIIFLLRTIFMMIMMHREKLTDKIDVESGP